MVNPTIGKRKNEHVSTSTIRDIHKLLRSCFQQAIKWELMEKNPCIYATVPKHKTKKREIWTAETLMYAMEVCEDERLKLAMNLFFSCSLRISELLGFTWVCVDISEEAIEENRAYIFINKVGYYVLFMLTLAMHPDVPGVFAIDSFDHTLNPGLAKRITEIFSQLIIESGKTVFMTTHNPLVLDGLNLAGDRIRLFAIDKNKYGYAELNRIQISQELLETGQSLSRLWINGLLGGVPELL